MDARDIPFCYRPMAAARSLDISRSQIFKLLKSGEIRCFKVGAATLISADELKRWVERQERQTRYE